MDKLEKVKEALERFSKWDLYLKDFDTEYHAGTMAKEALAELNEFMEGEEEQEVHEIPNDVLNKQRKHGIQCGRKQVQHELQAYLQGEELREVIARELWETAQEIQDDDKWRTMSFDPTREECFMLAKRVQAAINVIKEGNNE